MESFYLSTWDICFIFLKKNLLSDSGILDLIKKFGGKANGYQLESLESRIRVRCS